METLPQTYIYGLVDPRDNRLRYVGKANNPRVRYCKHVTEINTSHKSRWIQQLRREGLLPWLLILDVVSIDQWQQYEADLIECHRAQLTNVADGGIAPTASAETRVKQRQAKLGKSPPNKGKSASIEARHKQSISAKLRRERMTKDELAELTRRAHENRSPESYSNPGWHHSAEAKAKIASTSRGRKTTNKLTREQVIEVVNLLKTGMQQTHIAKQFCVSPLIITNIKRGHTYSDWSGIAPSTTDYREDLARKYARLTDEQALQVLDLRDQGMKLDEIAQRVNATWGIVQGICSGKKYKHLRRKSSELE